MHKHSANKREDEADPGEDTRARAVDRQDECEDEEERDVQETVASETACEFE
ncbi:hypothetical protein LBMAG57_00990 [Verrucomicrobiota bacterium]|nr:hypothetical protein LBMAG57_00990 [Verrucomicrobiota bacterium]